MVKCIVCFDRIPIGLATLCERCGKSYDRNGGGDGSVMAVIVWAADRARYFERRRKAK